MPIKLYIYAATLILGIGIGTGITYKVMRSQVLSMELKIADQKVEAAKILAEETQKVASAEEAQRILNINLDKAHEAYINTSNTYSSKLNDAIGKLRVTTSRQSCNSTSTKSDNSAINPANGEEFVIVSKALLRYLAEESKRADTDGIDKNTLLDFVKRDNCGITK